MSNPKPTSFPQTLRQSTSVDRHTSIILEPFLFPHAEWLMKGQGNEASVHAIPGTWFTYPGAPALWIAMVCCPACHSVSVLHKGIHTVSNLGKIDPSFICKYRLQTDSARECGFHRNIYLDNWNKKPLYACAILENGKMDIVYVHAKTTAEAIQELGAGPYQIMAIGPAVGFKVTDAHGEKLIGHDPLILS